MLYYNQTILGKNGDCFRTCIACLLNVEPIDVPHVYENPLTTGKEGEILMNNYLKQFDIYFIHLPISGDYKAVTNWMKSYNPNYYLLSGESSRGNTHVVIMQEDKMIHDPHPSNDGLIGPDKENGYYWISLLCKITN